MSVRSTLALLCRRPLLVSPLSGLVWVGAIKVGYSATSFRYHYRSEAIESGHSLTPRLALQLNGGASLGRTDTSAFWVDLIPELDHLEAPRRYSVRTAQLGLGLAFRL